MTTDKTFALEKIIVRETEKAILVRCLDLRTGEHDVWFPRSQIEIGKHFIFVAEWLAAAKMRDTGKTLGSTDFTIASDIEAGRLAA